MDAVRGPGPELPFDEREIVLRVDFDDLDEDECCWVSMHFLRGPRHPIAGDTVYLLDTAGGGCMADVVEVMGWSARVEPDWSTWTGKGSAPTG